MHAPTARVECQGCRETGQARVLPGGKGCEADGPLSPGQARLPLGARTTLNLAWAMPAFGAQRWASLLSMPGWAVLGWGACQPPPGPSRVMNRAAPVHTFLGPAELLPRPQADSAAGHGGRAHPGETWVPTGTTTLFFFFLPCPAVPGVRRRAQRGGGGSCRRDAGGHGPRRKPETRPDLQGHPRAGFPAGFPARAVRPAALRLRRRPPTPTPGVPAGRGPGGRPEELEGSPAPRPSPELAFSRQAFSPRRGRGPRSPQGPQTLT